MSIDHKFLEGYVTIMKANGVGPSQAYAMFQKEAKIGGLLKGLGLMGAGGAATLGGAWGINKLMELPNKFGDTMDARDQYAQDYYGSSNYTPNTANAASTTSTPAYRSWSNNVATSTPNTPAQATTPTERTVQDASYLQSGAINRRQGQAIATTAERDLIKSEAMIRERMAAIKNPGLHMQAAYVLKDTPVIGRAANWFLQRPVKALESAQQTHKTNQATLNLGKSLISQGDNLEEKAYTAPGK